MSNTDACPYCGQINISGEDARTLCGCAKAKRFRKIIKALDKQSYSAAPMEAIDEGAMKAMRDIANLIVIGVVDQATVKLHDRTTVVIGGKVSRTVRLRVEEKVDE